ncbi:MAG: DUF4268 domain-containing protein [Candidatus Poribacteria bacterium]|nr:DUF4268 domain-containing protein [Candidatus Poribacteria bacterium]MDE0397661.1 DUF4268 domain-containing protein [Candidatus Poribacteria bacterium]
MRKESTILITEIDKIRTGLQQRIYRNEAEVCQGIVDVLLRHLGWQPGFVRREYQTANGRVDYALCDQVQNPLVLIEAKKVDSLAGAEEQLFSYVDDQNVPMLILTDGEVWKFFYPSGRGSYDERLVCELNLSDTDSDNNVYRLQRYLSFAMVQKGVAFEAFESDYNKAVRQKEALRQLPLTWQELVDTGNEHLIEVIAEATEDACRHKPSTEQVLDFLKTLTSSGGNDLLPTPSERKAKYIAYFQDLIDELRERHKFTNARIPQKNENSNYYNFSSGFPQIGYVAAFKKGTVQTRLWIHFPSDEEKTQNFFDVLKERESEINAKFEAPLYWERRDGQVTSLIYIKRDGDINSDASELKVIKAWHVENLRKFRNVFTPEIQLVFEKWKVQ